MIKTNLGEEKTELLLNWSLGLRDIGGRASGRSDMTLVMMMIDDCFYHYYYYDEDEDEDDDDDDDDDCFL